MLIFEPNRIGKTAFTGLITYTFIRYAGPYGSLYINNGVNIRFSLYFCALNQKIVYEKIILAVAVMSTAFCLAANQVAVTLRPF